MFWEYLYKFYAFNHRWMTNRNFLLVLIIWILTVNTYFGITNIYNSINERKVENVNKSK